MKKLNLSLVCFRFGKYLDQLANSVDVISMIDDLDAARVQLEQTSRQAPRHSMPRTLMRQTTMAPTLTMLNLDRDPDLTC